MVRQTLRALGTLALLASAGAVLSCSQERDPISRVQPDFLDKSQLIPVQYGRFSNGGSPGELTADLLRRETQWMHQITIIDKPPTTGRSGISSYTQVERIYWEVTERMLIARQAYDRLAGGQNNPDLSSVGQDPRQTEVVAAYAITKHFDVRNDYNSTTGEPLNVVLENDTDRPWYQRRFMRVDWSRNLVGTFNPLSGIDGSMPAEPAVFQNTPDDPNRPVFDCGARSCNDLSLPPGSMRYFDVTNRMILHPEQQTLNGTTYQACLLYDNINSSCQPADVTMRVSFMRVDPTRDYQPVALDGHRMDRFGFFEDRRTGYDNHLGAPGQLQSRHWANRHNLWAQHHVRTTGSALDHKSGDLACRVDGDCARLSGTAKCDQGTHTCGEVYLRCAPETRSTDAAERQRSADAQCAAVHPGSWCDTDVAYTRGDNTGLCLLPYRERTVRPIAYHLSPNYPERMMPVTTEIASQWNGVFSDAVREARYRECLLDPQGGGEAGCASWRDLSANSPRTADSRFVWVACHNPVWGADASKPGAHSAAEVAAARAQGWDLDACGPQGTVARLGDVRYSMIGSINQYDQQGPWGLAEITGDPVTGEVISGRGAVWQTVTDAQAAFATDLIRILNRDVTPESFSQGQTVLDAYDPIRASGAREGRVANHPRAVHQDLRSRAEIQTLLQQTTFEHLRTVQNPVDLSAEGIQRFSVDTDGRHTEDAFLRNTATMLRDQLPTTQGRDTPSQRMASLRGAPIESSLMDREMILAGDGDPAAPPTDAVLDRASPFRQNNFQFRETQRYYQSLMEQHECRYEADLLADDVVTVMLRRFRRNELPADVRFGRTWNFHTGDAAACPESVESGNCPLNYDEVNRYLQQFVHYGVLLHELGHSIGERHNFSGSADAINYFDQYWPLRATAANANVSDPPVRADELRPRFTHMADGKPFYSPAEEQGGVEEYAYSSVMDYKGWNEDAHGLGRYDRAFVLHGYVDMVEAFDRVAQPAEALNAFEGMVGGYQSAVRFAYTGDRTAPQLASYHYTDIPRLVGVNAQGRPDIQDDNRYPVFLRETERRGYNIYGWDPDHTNITVAARNGSPDTNFHLLVPYMFNTDGYANSIWNTQRYDAGADMFESMRYLSEHYFDYYFANAYARGRAAFTVSGYRSRMTSRYLDQAYYSMRGVSYIVSYYQNLFGALPQWQAFLGSDSVVSARLGLNTVLDMLGNAVVMPQASVINPGSGRHCPNRRVDGTIVLDRVNATAGCVDLSIFEGREYSSYFDFGSGNFWRERIVNAGNFHDKSIGLDYLTNTFIWSPERFLIEYQDPQRFQINMYSMYPAQTLRFFGSVLSRDVDDFGVQARNTSDGIEINRLHLATINLPRGTQAGQSGRDTSNTAVDPNLGFSLELQALTYLFGQLDASFDRTARQSVRIWREGDTWALPAADARAFVTFTNPFTNVTYFAVHQGGGRSEVGAAVGLSRRDTTVNETAVAGRMLIYANALKTAWQRAPEANRSQAAANLEAYIDLIERAREFSGRFN